MARPRPTIPDDWPESSRLVLLSVGCHELTGDIRICLALTNGPPIDGRQPVAAIDPPIWTSEN